MQEDPMLTMKIITGTTLVLLVFAVVMGFMNPHIWDDQTCVPQVDPLAQQIEALYNAFPTGDSLSIEKREGLVIQLLNNCNQ